MGTNRTVLSSLIEITFTVVSTRLNLFICASALDTRLHSLPFAPFGSCFLGQYDITSSPYTQSLATSIPAPHLVSNPPSGMFGGNSTPAPDTYNPLYPSSSSPGANGLRMSQGPRKSVVDAAAAAAADTPAPHDYDPQDPRFTHHSSSSQKEWPPNSVPFVFAPPSDTPGPGGPLPGSMGTFPLGGVNLGKGSERVAFTESIAKANAWKVGFVCLLRRARMMHIGYV